MLGPALPPCAGRTVLVAIRLLRVLIGGEVAADEYGVERSEAPEKDADEGAVTPQDNSRGALTRGGEPGRFQVGEVNLRRQG